MVVLVVMTLTVGGVLLLRPISRRLGDLFEAMAAERRDSGVKDELARLREMNEIMSERLALLEERQEFTDALLRSPERQKLEGGDKR
jgi:hypothetical protein